MGMTHWVYTYAACGGWNGTLGFHSEAAAIDYARSYANSYPGSRAEVHTDACVERQSRETANVALFIQIEI